MEEVTLRNKTAEINIYKWQDDAVERASLLKSGYEMDLKDPETVQIFLESASMGIEGYIPWDGKLPAEKFEPDGSISETDWSSRGFKNPKCLTLWKGHPDNSNSSPLTKWTSQFVPGGGEYESRREYDSIQQ